MRAPRTSGARHRFGPVRDIEGEYVISRFGYDAPRLVEVVSREDQWKRIHGRDVMRGGALRIRAGDVIARHTSRDEAIAAFEALKAALPELDAEVCRARAAYDRAVRRRLKAQAAIAAGPAKAETGADA